MPTKAVPKIAIKPIFKNNSIFLLCNPYWLQTKDKKNKAGIYEASLTVKASKRIPNKIEAIADLQGLFLSEKGNKNITGQHGDIPFILIQFGDNIMRNGKQIAVQKINIFFLFLSIFFQNLYPIYCLW